ncbi:hypothetical protein ES703_91068 [subsurface metagenome]
MPLHNYTISFFIKLTNKDKRQAIFAESNIAIGEVKWVYIDANNKLALDYWPPGGGVAASITPLETDRLYHCAVTESPTQRRLFINGDFDVAAPAEDYIGQPIDDRRLGDRYYLGASHFLLDGILDEFRIDHRILTDAEIKLQSQRRYPL